MASSGASKTKSRPRLGWWWWGQRRTRREWCREVRRMWCHWWREAGPGEEKEAVDMAMAGTSSTAEEEVSRERQFER
jgi:hypothetical protein